MKKTIAMFLFSLLLFALPILAEESGPTPGIYDDGWFEKAINAAFVAGVKCSAWVVINHAKDGKLPKYENILKEAYQILYKNDPKKARESYEKYYHLFYE